MTAQIAWRQRRTGRARNLRAAELRQADLEPVCPRCAEINEPGTLKCATCGCRLTA